MRPETDAKPATIHKLTRPEHLLVWAMRAIALGHEDDPVVVRTFRQACGAEGRRTLDAYGMFVCSVAAAAQGRLRVHVPGCPCLSPDEAAVVGCIAAAQRSLTERDETGLRRALTDLMGAPPTEPLLFLAQAIGRLLGDAGLELPSQLGESTAAQPRPIQPRNRVLH